MYTLLAIVDNKVVETTTYGTLQEMRDYQVEHTYYLHGVCGDWATFGSETKADKVEQLIEGFETLYMAGYSLLAIGQALELTLEEMYAIPEINDITSK